MELLIGTSTPERFQDANSISSNNLGRNSRLRLLSFSEKEKGYTPTPGAETLLAGYWSIEKATLSTPKIGSSDVLPLY